jgi:gliding motility-associated-like protein
VILKYYHNECPYYAKAYVHIYEQPTADFSLSNDNICITDQVTIDYIGNAPSGTPTWNFDNGQIISGSGLAQHSIKWSSAGLKTISLEVENNNCTSTPYTATVMVHDTLDDIIIDCEPATDSIAFIWNTDSKASAYKILIDGVLVDSAFISKYVVYGLSPGDQVTITIIAIDKGICGNKPVTEQCTAIQCPDYVIDIQPEIDTICLDDNSIPISFVATIAESDGTGSIEWSGNGIDKNTGVFDPAIAGPGTHTISMKFKEVCSADTSFTIEVIQRPVTQLSVDDDAICVTDSAVIHFLSNNPTNTIYDWNLNGGIMTIIDQSTFSLKWNTPGTYSVSLKTSNDICEADTKSISVTVEPELIAPIINCSSTTNSIEISWNSVDCAGSYNVFVNGDMVLNTTDLKYNLKNLDPNTQIDFVVEAVTQCECPTVSTSMNCSTEPCPDITLEIENLPNQICISDININITLNAKITGLNTGAISWKGQSIDNNGNLNLTGFSVGQYVYTLNYEVSKCDYSITDTILITPLPYYDISSINPLCYGDENGGIIVTADSDYEYYLDGVKYDNSSFHDLAEGTYNVTVKDFYGCQSSETITLVNPDQMEPTILGADFIKENSAGHYTLSNVDNFEFQSIVWYFENGDTICNGTQCTSIDIQITQDRSLCVDIVNTNGCDASVCFDLRYIENVDIDIPNIFSPDDDAINDVFYISSDNTVEIVKELKIYDRWGELVFSKDNFPTNDKSFGWDGSFNGKKLNPGVFVYFVIFKIKDRPDLKAMGDITIIR